MNSEEIQSVTSSASPVSELGIIVEESLDTLPTEPMETVTETPQEILEETTQEILEETPQEALEETTQEILEETTQKVFEETLQDAPEETPAETSLQTTEFVEQESTKNIEKKVSFPEPLESTEPFTASDNENDTIIESSKSNITVDTDQIADIAQQDQLEGDDEQQTTDTDEAEEEQQEEQDQKMEQEPARKKRKITSNTTDLPRRSPRNLQPVSLFKKAPSKSNKIVKALQPPLVKKSAKRTSSKPKITLNSRSTLRQTVSTTVTKKPASKQQTIAKPRLGRPTKSIQTGKKTMSAKPTVGRKRKASEISKSAKGENHVKYISNKDSLIKYRARLSTIDDKAFGILDNCWISIYDPALRARTKFPEGAFPIKWTKVLADVAADKGITIKGVLPHYGRTIPKTNLKAFEVHSEIVPADQVAKYEKVGHEVVGGRVYIGRNNAVANEVASPFAFCAQDTHDDKFWKGVKEILESTSSSEAEDIEAEIVAKVSI